MTSLLLAAMLAQPAVPVPAPGGAPLPAPALPALSPDQGSVLRRALEEDCGVGEDPPLSVAVKNAGAALVPHLAAAAAAGHPDALADAVETAANRRYDILYPSGVPPAPARAVYIKRQVVESSLAYRQRAVRALGWIGGLAATAALQAVADPELKPYADLALARLGVP